MALNQVLLEVETEKAVVELPSPYETASSSCSPRRARPSPSGSPIIAIVTGAADGGRARGPGGGRGEDRDGGRNHTEKDGRPSGSRCSSAMVRPRRGEAPPRRPPTGCRRPPPRSAPSLGRAALRPMPASGVDLAHVTGHGPDGLITREDLAAHLAATETPPVTMRWVDVC